MQRIPEPELMESAAQAEAYAAADFDAANSDFMRHLASLLQGEAVAGHVLDLGCGPADICLRLAHAHARAEIHALDGSAAMLACARARLAQAPALAGRIRLLHQVLPVRSLPASRYELILSNSLLHHLHDPAVLWTTVRDFGASGTGVLVMDLCRPVSPAAARQIVEQYSGAEPAVLQQDFYNSLLAAFTPEEVVVQLQAAGLEMLRVRLVSDRHLLVSGRLP
jgi:trans-aconitate methyltransferase